MHLLYILLIDAYVMLLQVSKEDALRTSFSLFGHKEPAKYSTTNIHLNHVKYQINHIIYIM